MVVVTRQFTSFLDGVPSAIDTEKIRSSALRVPGVKDIHHLHIWAISTTENALTAHLKVDQNNTMEETEKIKQQVKHELCSSKYPACYTGDGIG
jgi:cobalt-zinc-cadmium efflux system protein